MNCCLPGCTNYYVKNNNVSYLSLPKPGVDDEWRGRLIAAISCGDKNLKPNVHGICSAHFTNKKELLFFSMVCTHISTMYIYIYIKWTVFVNVTTKSAQHAHARMITKKSFKWFTNSRRITLKTKKKHHNQSKRPVTITNALINTTLLHRCSYMYTIEYNAETRFSCIWD